MSLIKIIVYQTNTQKEPFTEWYLGLDTKVKAIITSRLKRICSGNFGDSKLLKQAAGIREIRIDYGPGYRVYFVMHGNTIVILLNGGDKKSQDRDIGKAKKFWLDYKELYEEKT